MHIRSHAFCHTKRSFKESFYNDLVLKGLGSKQPQTFRVLFPFFEVKMQCLLANLLSADHKEHSKPYCTSHQVSYKGLHVYYQRSL